MYLPSTVPFWWTDRETIEPVNEEQRRRQQEYKRERRQDPEYRARERERQNERRRKRADDAEYQERRREYRREYRRNNPEYRERARNRSSEWREKNPDYLQQQRERHHNRMQDPEYRDLRRARVWRNKGINATVEDFNEFYEEQHGLCAICCGSFEVDDLKACLDHCHDCHDVRGILCHGCNSMTGFYELYPSIRHVWDIEEVNDYIEQCSCYA